MVFIEILVFDVYVNVSYLEGGILYIGYGMNMNIFLEGVFVVFEVIIYNGFSL